MPSYSVVRLLLLSKDSVVCRQGGGVGGEELGGGGGTKACAIVWQALVWATKIKNETCIALLVA
jgi:ribulose 1,5-bisphosphate carboxylase large subunit-like protein